MRYSYHDQRKMDAEYSLHMDSVERQQKPCRSLANVGHPEDGSCIRCGAIVGEACRDGQK